MSIETLPKVPEFHSQNGRLLVPTLARFDLDPVGSLISRFPRASIDGTDILQDHTALEVAELYKRKAAIASLSYADMYDFWLLSRTAELLFEPGVSFGNTGYLEELRNQYHAAVRQNATRYAFALSHEVVRKEAETEQLVVGDSFKDTDHTNHVRWDGYNDIVRDRYAKIIEGTSPKEELLSLATYIFDYNNWYFQGNFRDFDGNPDPWLTAITYAAQLHKLLEDESSSSQTTQLICIVDSLNGLFHNSGSMGNRMVDQSSKNKEYTALCESMMPDNLHILYAQASPFVRSLFKASGGTTLLITEKPVMPGTDEYFKKLGEAFEIVNSRRGKTLDYEQETIFAELIQELAEEYGYEKAFFVLEKYIAHGKEDVAFTKQVLSQHKQLIA